MGFPSLLVSVSGDVMSLLGVQLGGAISGYGMNITATECGVVLNTAERNGGGLRLSYGSTAVVIGGNISSNSGEPLSW